MKKSNRIFVKLLVVMLCALCTALALSACSESVSVSLTPQSAAIGVGETVTLTATAQNTDEQAAFSSSDPSVAAVSQEGVVTGVAPGTATITARAGGKSAETSVTVKPYFYADAQTKTIELYGAQGLKDLNKSVNTDGSEYHQYTIRLKSDADLGGEVWKPLSGYSLTECVWEGGGHTVSNLVINERNTSEVNTGGDALDTIGFISGTSRITMRDIVFDNVQISTDGTAYYGIVVGYLDGDGTFENVTVQNSSIETSSSRGTAALVGFINDVVRFPGGVESSSLEITGCKIKNVTVKSAKSAGLVGRMCNAIVNPELITGDEPANTWYAYFYDCEVTGCSFYTTVSYNADGAQPVHWAANDMTDMIGSAADRDNTQSGNRFYFAGAEYTYSNGTYTAVQ